MRRSSPARIVLALLLVTAAAVATIGYRNARADPIVRLARVRLADWPAGALPVTVALASDIHLGGIAMDPARLTRIVARIDSLNPDLVLLAGDFVAGHDRQAAVTSAAALVGPLAGLRAPLGTVAVLGNHDEATAPVVIAKALRRAGIVVLENQAIARGPLAIGGFGDVFSRHDDPLATLAALRGLSGARIALTHSPDLSPRLHADIGLLLAGHTHCGQVVLPGFGAAVRRSPLIGRVLYDRRYRCGIVRDVNRTTIVTGGLGGLPFRWGAPPDIWLIRLGPAAR